MRVNCRELFTQMYEKKPFVSSVLEHDKHNTIYVIIYFRRWGDLKLHTPKIIKFKSKAKKNL